MKNIIAAVILAGGAVASSWIFSRRPQSGRYVPVTDGDDPFPNYRAFDTATGVFYHGTRMGREWHYQFTDLPHECRRHVCDEKCKLDPTVAAMLLKGRSASE